MRPLLPGLVLLCGCPTVDTERIRVRGNGLQLEVISRADADQPHARHFEVTVDPVATVEVRCTVAGQGEEDHRRTLGRGTELSATLFGLLAQRDHRCTVTAERDGRSLSGELEFTTDPPQAAIPAMSVVSTGEAWGHYTLFNTWVTGEGGTDQVLLIVDPQGRPRWSQLLPDETSVGVEASHLGGRELLIGGGTLAPHGLSLGGQIRWTLPELSGPKRFWHHEASLSPHGTVLGVHALNNSGPTGPTWEGFRIVEGDRTTGEELWSWESQPAFDAGELSRLPGDDDPWHANAVSWVSHPQGDFVSVSLARLHRILAIDPASGALLWQLGEGGDFALDGDWFSGQHDPEWTDDGRLLLHDNGFLTGTSRLLELQVDPAARTAQTLWQWVEPDWFEPLWGDADRLPDGTVLLTRGHCEFCPDTGSGRSQIAVVDPTTGQVSWRLTLGDPTQGLYRSERIDGCELFDNQRYCDAGR